ncbi:MAG: peptidoglycan bridge formation glycyltransferase FemA/FemB family protein [Treponema sp.]|nr:peptidoglycan bridge formation glycyltransferase FemA/FemB family protein [Treponema sp.]
MSPATGVPEPLHLRQILRADLSACDQADNFLQSGFWGSFKERFGWQAYAFNLEWMDALAPCASLLVLRRFLAAGVSLAYIPWGPQLPAGFPSCWQARCAALKELALALKEQLPADTAFIRFDPPWQIMAADAFAQQPMPPFVRAPADIQAPDTVLVDISTPMESVMERMKPKWRYNARLALKRGVVARRAGAQEISVFYDLLKETAQRDGIAIHGIGYYKTLLESGQCSGVDVRLYLAEYEGDALAGIVTLFRGQQAVYLYGASSDKKRPLMAAYALQVKAMEDARKAGCVDYDLFGIPPNDDPSHPMAGLYRFKTGFGGRIVHRPGSWDFPCRPFAYRLFRVAEDLRKKLRNLKKKRPASAAKDS